MTRKDLSTFHTDAKISEYFQSMLGRIHSFRPDRKSQLDMHEEVWVGRWVGVS